MAIRMLHRRVLFDAHGLWLARNDKENFAIQEFVTKKRPLMYPLVSLPRKCFVVELRSAKEKGKSDHKEQMVPMMHGMPMMMMGAGIMTSTVMMEKH